MLLVRTWRVRFAVMIVIAVIVGGLVAGGSYGRSDQAQAQGFAIPGDVVTAAGPQPGGHEDGDRPYVGISYVPVTPQLAQAQSLPVAAGAWITDVDPRCPAQKAGLRVGDIIVSVNGQPVTDEGSLTSALINLSAGSSVSLGIERGPRALLLHMTLGSLQHP